MEEDVTNVTTLNLTKVCRVCLSESEVMHSIFSEMENRYSLEENMPFVYEILMNLSSIKVCFQNIR